MHRLEQELECESTKVLQSVNCVEYDTSSTASTQNVEITQVSSTENKSMKVKDVIESSVNNPKLEECELSHTSVNREVNEVEAPNSLDKSETFNTTTS